MLFLLDFQALSKPVLGKIDQGQARADMPGFVLVIYVANLLFYMLVTHLLLFTSCH
jgi:hypothetical protein